MPRNSYYTRKERDMMNKNKVNINEVKAAFMSNKSGDKISIIESPGLPEWSKTIDLERNKDPFVIVQKSFSSYTAQIGWEGQSFDYGFSEGFFQIAHNSIGLALRSSDTIVFPIIFNYRHYLEIVLKSNLLRFQIYFREPISLPHTHKLDLILNNLEKLLNKYNISFLITPFQTKVIKYFANIDPLNDKYRYVYNNEGSLNHKDNIEYIDLKELHLDMNKVYSEFKSLDYLFDESEGHFRDSLLYQENQALLLMISKLFNNKKAESENQLKSLLGQFKYTFESEDGPIVFSFDINSLEMIAETIYYFTGKTNHKDSGPLGFKITIKQGKIDSLQLAECQSHDNF